MPVYIVDPAQARGFARALRRKAKTDHIDAVMVARCLAATIGDLRPYAPDPATERLAALVDYRRRLIADKTGLLSYRGVIEDKTIRAMVTRQTATRYVALSRTLPPARMLAVTRAHWSIENQLHWTLDVVFDEDDARSRRDYGPENLAVIRRRAQNILRMHPSPKSIASKMRRATWSKEFFFELFAYMR